GQPEPHEDVGEGRRTTRGRRRLGEFLPAAHLHLPLTRAAADSWAANALPPTETRRSGRWRAEGGSDRRRVGASWLAPGARACAGTAGGRSGRGWGCRRGGVLDQCPCRRDDVPFVLEALPVRLACFPVAAEVVERVAGVGDLCQAVRRGHSR